MQQSINLITKLDRPQKEWLRAELLLWLNGGVLALFLVLALGIFLLGQFDDQKLQQLRSDVENLDKELDSKRLARDRHLDPGKIDQQITQLDAQLKLNRKILEIFESRTGEKHDPLSAYMQGLANQHLRGLWFTGFSVSEAGEKLSLRGQTSDPAFVPRYLKMLRAEAVFSGKSFNIFQLSQDPEKSRILNFEIQSSDQREDAVAEVISAPVAQMEEMP